MTLKIFNIIYEITEEVWIKIARIKKFLYFLLLNVITVESVSLFQLFTSRLVKKLNPVVIVVFTSFWCCALRPPFASLAVGFADQWISSIHAWILYFWIILLWRLSGTLQTMCTSVPFLYLLKGMFVWFSIKTPNRYKNCKIIFQ